MYKIYIYICKNREEFTITTKRTENGFDSTFSATVQWAKLQIHCKSSGGYKRAPQCFSWLSEVFYYNVVFNGLRRNVVNNGGKKACNNFKRFCRK